MSPSPNLNELDGHAIGRRSRQKRTPAYAVTQQSWADAELREMRMHRMQRRALRMSLSAASASMDAAATIAARTPIIAEALGTGSPAALAETRRMVVEKIDAAVEGGVAASLAWTRLCFRMGMGLSHPGEFAHEMGKIVHAASAPGRRKVRSNARRLGRGATKKAV